MLYTSGRASWRVWWALDIFTPFDMLCGGSLCPTGHIKIQICGIWLELLYGTLNWTDYSSTLPISSFPVRGTYHSWLLFTYLSEVLVIKRFYAVRRPQFIFFPFWARSMEQEQKKHKAMFTGCTLWVPILSGNHGTFLTLPQMLLLTSCMNDRL